MLRNHSQWLPGVAVLAAVAILTGMRLRAQDDAARAIVPDSFLNARPQGPASTSATKPVYRPAGPPAGAVPGGGSSIDIGLTLWRLRPSRAADRTRLLTHEGPQTAEWTPERVRLDGRLVSGDRVRLTIESPRDGYLYVVDSEKYADGSVGQPYLIFPTMRTRAGDNKVAAGRLVDVPGQEDAPPYFTLQPSRPDHVGERLTVIVVREPLVDVPIGSAAAQLSRDRVSAWEKRGAGQVERFEMQSGAGGAWSSAERAAAADGTRRLTREDPPPQTLFRIRGADPAFIVVPIEIAPVRRGANGR